MENINIQNKKKVIVIGSGISGLAAAQHLLNQKDLFEVKILEARNIYGGRVSKNIEFATDFPIETGAEEIHIKESQYYKVAESSGAQVLADTNLVHYIEDINEEKLVERDAFFEQYKLNEFYEKIEGLYDDINYEDNCEEIFLKNGLSPVFLPFYEPFWGAENGSTLKEMSLKAQLEYDEGWSTDHDDNFLLQNMSHFDVLGQAFQGAIQDIEFEQAVNEINYEQRENNQIIINTTQGKQYEADAVIVTVPLSILKKGYIRFTPELPEDKKKAINIIKMGKGGKLHLKFKERFWGDNTGMMFFRSKIGFLWDCSYLRSQKSYILCCLVSGQVGEDLNNEEKRKDLMNELFEKLNKVFKVKSQDLLEKYLWTEYSSIPFLEGTYSYASFAPTTIRNNIAESIQNKVFFAGEATNSVYFATLHGAYDTGIREAEKIIQLFK